jgi:hypothetical protein
MGAIKRIINVEAGQVSFQMDGFQTLVLNARDPRLVPVNFRATLAGYNSTIGDAAALETIKLPGGGVRKPTMAEKHAAMASRIETLLSGKWSSEREAADFTLLAEALQRLSKVSMDLVQREVEGMDAETKKTLMTEDKDIAVEVMKIRRERLEKRMEGAEKPEASSILAKLKAMKK